MYTKLLPLLLVSLPCLNCQNSEMVYFPDDNGDLLDRDNVVKIPGNVNLTQIRGTSMYETYVDKIISGGISKLTLAINKALIQKTKTDQENIVFAPVSIAAALALILLGSNGKTFEEITAVMGLATGINIQSKSLQVHEQFGRIISKLETTSGFYIGHQVNFAAAVFVQNNFPIRSVYKKAAEDLYESEIFNVDFQSNPVKAQQIINAWVSERTKGKIGDILSDVPSGDTKVIIASAMYFKAMWEKPFFEGTTTRRLFYPNGRKSNSNIEVEMMANGGDFPYFRDHNLNCEVMGFPYKGNATTMYVVMPFNSSVEKLKDLELRLTPSDLEHLADSTVSTRAVLTFPKMKIESTIDLKSSLELLGIKTLFRPSEANLALLSPGEGITSNLSAKVGTVEKNPLAATADHDIIIFNRFGQTVNCTSIFDPSNNLTTCQDADTNGTSVVYKKIGNKIGRKFTSRIGTPTADSETIDNVRQIINQQSTDNSYQNPGLYADKVVHKVYMDITETGTEAAATTSISLPRDGGRVTFRVDVPFFFFIRNEETKTILFWGSVTLPTPNYRKS